MHRARKARRIWAAAGIVAAAGLALALSVFTAITAIAASHDSPGATSAASASTGSTASADAGSSGPGATDASASSVSTTKAGSANPRSAAASSDIASSSIASRPAASRAAASSPAATSAPGDASTGEASTSDGGASTSGNPGAGGTVVSTGQTLTYNEGATGYCTWWAANEFHAYSGLYPDMSDPVNDGNAGYWAVNAVHNGWTVTSTPRVDSIAVFPPGVDGAESEGHVAWVTGVSGPQVTISEMNGPAGWDQVDTRTLIPASSVSYILAPGPAPLGP